MSHTVKAYGLRKDGTIGAEEPGRPVALFIESLEDARVSQFIWSDQSVGPVDAAVIELLPVQPPLPISFSELVRMTLLLSAGVVVALLGLAVQPFGVLKTRSNCMFHAFARMFRHPGAAIIWMPSRFGWWLHCASALQGLLLCEEYYPVARKRQRRAPPFIFTGHVQPWVVKA